MLISDWECGTAGAIDVTIAGETRSFCPVHDSEAALASAERGAALGLEVTVSAWEASGDPWGPPSDGARGSATTTGHRGAGGPRVTGSPFHRHSRPAKDAP